ncbi:DUF563 domain-containing protein [Penicillium malachiteum]|uniref:EGF domain-specific O-linked N-acetylglucosamine transferase n=1 Tax=Penicillium malachiteum TaxID=1324776 RepID=A0AAD6HKT2_9EURO|nr:DUF563 domain-containing protein [Penicillium malachiteum]
MTLTMDVLQMMQPSKNLPVQYIAERDAANTQLVLLDDEPDEQIVPRQNDEITFTFINRVSGRRLFDMDEYLDQLSKIFPRVKIQSIDFAAIFYKDQLEIIQNTDILAGIHGAGLTHGIFLPPGSAMVEILPYDLNHKGFRKIAALRGHGY